MHNSLLPCFPSLRKKNMFCKRKLLFSDVFSFSFSEEYFFFFFFFFFFFSGGRGHFLFILKVKRVSFHEIRFTQQVEEV